MLKRSVVTTVVLLIGLVLGFGSLAFTQEKPGRGDRGGQYPQIHAAMRSLEQAARHLDRAEHVYGGHRAKALELVKQAQGELKAAIEYARANPPKGKPATGTAPPTGTTPPAATTTAPKQ